MEKIWIGIGGRIFIAYILGLVSIMYLTNKGMNNVVDASPDALVAIVTSAFNYILMLTGVYAGVNAVQKVMNKNKDAK